MKKIIYIITLILVAIDQLTKFIINFKISSVDEIIIVDNFFSLKKMFNYGASWSLFNGFVVVFIIIALIALVVLYKYQKRFKEGIYKTMTFSLLFAGIIGNLLDRCIHGYVIDYLKFVIFNYNFPIFNVADICVVSGVILLIIGIIGKRDINEIVSTKWCRY